jgi:hypothetical protein
MPVLSAAHRFGAAVLTAAALFTLTDADPAGAWPDPLAFAFWLATVGAGLGLAVGAAAVLVRRPAWARRPRWQVVALSGGLLGRGSLVRKRLEQRLKSAVPGATVRSEEVDAARGAIRRARRLLGVEL